MLHAACLDPILESEIDVRENHAPILSDVAPQPGSDPIELTIGRDCAASTSFRGRLEDLDEDVLVARWNLLVKREGVEGGARERLLELALDPLPERGPEGQLYDFRPLEITLATLLVALDIGAIEAHSGETQLLELRVTDRSFLPGAEDPVPGAGFAYFSWAIRLLYEAGGCSQ